MAAFSVNNPDVVSLISIIRKQTSHNESLNLLELQKSEEKEDGMVEEDQKEEKEDEKKFK